MTFAGAIFLLAVGAILRYATNLHVESVSVDTVGLILMIAGAAGLIVAFFQETAWSRTRRREAAAAEQLRAEQQVPQQQPPPPPPPRY
jgi:cytochrome c oxidase subunit IV